MGAFVREKQDLACAAGKGNRELAYKTNKQTKKRTMKKLEKLGSKKYSRGSVDEA